jgi:hypothetical protein
MRSILASSEARRSALLESGLVISRFRVRAPARFYIVATHGRCQRDVARWRLGVGTQVAGPDYNEPMSGRDEMKPAGAGVKDTYDDFVQFPDVVFSNVDIVEPDLVYMSKARAAEVLTPQHVRGTPDLVVEVGSPGTRRRDEMIKRRLYERAGVTEYWIVDPELDLIRVYRRSDERFGRAIELVSKAGDVLTSELFPGLELPLAGVFAEPT